MSKILIRYTALLEGISWVSLLFIAMPLKYYFQSPLYVKYIGMGHGLLFVLLSVLLLEGMAKKVLDKRSASTVFIASFIPFGTFFTDKKLRD